MIYVVELSFPTQSRSLPRLIRKQSQKHSLPALFFCVSVQSMACNWGISGR